MLLQNATLTWTLLLEIKNKDSDLCTLKLILKNDGFLEFMSSVHLQHKKSRMKVDFRCSFQVIALICGIIVIILMIMGLASPDWLMAAGWKQGLFMHCIDVDAPRPLPFNMQEREGCYQSRDVGKCASLYDFSVFITNKFVVFSIHSGDHCAVRNNPPHWFCSHGFDIFGVESQRTSHEVQILSFRCYSDGISP